SEDGIWVSRGGRRESEIESSCPIPSAPRCQGLTRKSHDSETSWLRGSAKTRGLTTPSQGGQDLSRKHRVPRRRVDGAVCPQCFRPVRVPPLVLCEKVGLSRRLPRRGAGRRKSGCDRDLD